jgi:UDP-glucose 4-epimerase
MRTVPAPVTVYGAAKLVGEHYSLAYHQVYDLPTVVVRPFNSYGPREHDLGVSAEVIPRFVARVRNGLPPIIFGDGSAARDFTFVTETAAGIMAAADSDAAVGRTVNLAVGRPQTVSEVADAVLRVCGRGDLRPEFRDSRPGDVRHLHADVSVARELLGFEAHIDFEDGLRRYLRWVTAHRPDATTTLDTEAINWTLPAGHSGD